MAFFGPCPFLFTNKEIHEELATLFYSKIIIFGILMQCTDTAYSHYECWPHHIKLGPHRPGEKDTNDMLSLYQWPKLEPSSLSSESPYAQRWSNPFSSIHLITLNQRKACSVWHAMRSATNHWRPLQYTSRAIHGFIHGLQNKYLCGKVFLGWFWRSTPSHQREPARSRAPFLNTVQPLPQRI